MSARHEEQEDLGECRLLGVQNARSRCRKPRKLDCGHEVKKGESIYKTAAILDGDFCAWTKCTRCMDAEHGCTDEELERFTQQDEETFDAEYALAEAEHEFEEMREAERKA